MELKVVGEPGEEEVKVVPSVEGGSLLIELDEEELVDLIGIESRTVGMIGVQRIAIDTITLSDVDEREYPAIKNGNSYLKKQLVRPAEELGFYSLNGTIKLNLDGSRHPKILRVNRFQEVAPFVEAEKPDKTTVDLSDPKNVEKMRKVLTGEMTIEEAGPGFSSPDGKLRIIVDRKTFDALRDGPSTTSE